MSSRAPRSLLLIALAVIAAACTGEANDAPKEEIEAAKHFDGYPLYWVGERFEKWELRLVQGFETRGRRPRMVSFIYGDCEIDDPDGLGPEGGSCTPPLDIQISPLCEHLRVVAREPIWKRRQVRGAPVGMSDMAPVLFTHGAQIKVYRGQGTDPGVEIRVLRALRSINDVEPVIGPTGAIPAPPPSVLAGTRPCATKNA